MRLMSLIIGYGTLGVHFPPSLTVAIPTVVAMLRQRSTQKLMELAGIELATSAS